ncbi:hypothetical protein Patl1_15434 [Pistacia atlantica]|uniref:Uncharacterized protein n=1 Tax=Pistacia atlantica TaxID=434234 RepID=A0ACC1B647_9ROSI|nr:hypothetical protein Patl1_15434 [Pistacia atlantica]
MKMRGEEMKSGFAVQKFGQQRAIKMKARQIEEMKMRGEKMKSGSAVRKFGQ